MNSRREQGDPIHRRIGLDADKIQSAEQRRASYKHLMGTIAPRGDARISVTGALDLLLLDMQETMLVHALRSKCFDARTTQLMLLGMMLSDQADVALVHGVAARRAGASWEELQAVVNLAFVARGLPAADQGACAMAGIVKREDEDAVAAAVASYG